MDQKKYIAEYDEGLCKEDVEELDKLEELIKQKTRESGVEYNFLYALIDRLNELTENFDWVIQ